MNANSYASLSATVGDVGLVADVRGEVRIAADATPNTIKASMNVEAHASATGTVGPVSVKLNAEVKALATATAKGVDIKAGNLDVKRGKAEAVAAAKGLDVKVSDAGVQVTAKAEAKAKVVGVEVNAASIMAVSDRVHRGASASAEAKGLDVTAAAASFVGVEDKKEATAHVQTVGSEVRAATLSVTGEKKGASAEAAVNVQGAHVQAANVNVQGKDSSVSARATLHACPASMRAANVDLAPQGGTSFQATADFTKGIDAGNVTIGTHKGAGIGISTRLQCGNIGLTAGPPNLVFGPGLNLGLGGGQGSSGNRKGNGSSGHSGCHSSDNGTCGDPKESACVTSGSQPTMGGNGPSSHHASGVKGEKGAGIALALKAQHGTTEEISKAGTSAGMASGNSGHYKTGTGLREPRPRLMVHNGHGYTGRSSSLYVGGSVDVGQPTASFEHGRNTRYTNARSNSNVKQKNAVGRGSVLRQHETRPKCDNTLRTTGPPVEASGSSESRYTSRQDYRQPTSASSSTSGVQRNTVDGNPAHSVSSRGGLSQRPREPLPMTKLRSTGTGSMINGAFRSRNTLHQRSSDQDGQITHEKFNVHGHTVREKQRAQSMPKDDGHKRSGEDESMALSPDSISQPRNKGVYRVVTSHCDAQQQSCAKHSLDKDSHPSSKQGIVSPDNGSMVRDKEVKEVTRNGFEGTHRRNLHAGLSSKSHNSQGTRGDCDGSHSSNKGLGSKTSEKAPSSKPSSKPPSYVQGLTDLLSEKVKHLKPDKPKKANPKSESEIPLSREEAKRELKSRMKALKRDIDDTEEQKQKESQAGGKSGPGSGSNQSTQQSGGAAESEAEESSGGEAIKKPFGSKGNIYTLACFQNESSKQVKTLHGKIHGFEP